MSLPAGAASIESMIEIKKAMAKLENKMEKLFPKELSALIKKSPEIESITWEQFSEGGFSMNEFEINLRDGTKKFNEKEFRKEAKRLFSPMPSSVLLRLYDHHTQVVANKDGVKSDYNEDSDIYDSGDNSGAERETPGKVEFTDSPLGECFKEYYELRVQASESVESLLLDFVTGHKSEIRSMRWTQYTPGFCDGETCDFWVNSPSLLFVGASEHIGEYDTPTKDQQKLIKEAQKVLQSIHQGVLLHLYGDHTQLTVNGKKISKKQYYDHD